MNIFFVGIYMFFGIFNALSSDVVGIFVKGKGDCFFCRVGYFCFNGIVISEFCGKGKYINFGQLVCQICLVGRYCDNEIIFEVEMNVIKLCFVGRYCSVGLLDESDVIDCSKVYYCLEGQ